MDQENILRNFCLIYSPFSLGILSPQWNPNPKTKNIDDKCNDTQCSFILESEDKYNVSESQCGSSHLWSAARELKILSSSCQLSRPHFLCSEINKFTLNCLPAYFSVVPNNIFIKSTPCLFLLERNQRIELGPGGESHKNRISEKVKLFKRHNWHFRIVWSNKHHLASETCLSVYKNP